MKRVTAPIVLSLAAIGIMAGATGVILTIIMHTIQYYAFGYEALGEVSFRQIVEQASPLRRFIVLIGCGASVGIGWVAIHRYGSPLVTIKDTVDHTEKQMPVGTTILHALLQIITVALGSPLGREVAPREMSTALTTGLIRITHIGQDGPTRKVLLACAAGAGLAAVYNVPLASSVFILETLLVNWSFLDAGAALFACTIAVFVVRQGLGDLVQYPLPMFPINEWLSVWALIAGPVLAVAVYWFDKSHQALPAIPRKSPKMILIALAAFAAIGIMAVAFPEILGNGKAGNQLSFTDSISWTSALWLFGTKWAAVLLATVAGAYGGRITPSMMLGSMSALVLASAWNAFLPAIPLGSAAFVGAAVYLGLAQKMPITAVIFLLELTRYSPAYLFPVCACMATGLLCHTWLKNSAIVQRANLF